MNGLQTIQAYISHTGMKNADAYCMRVDELRTLYALSEQEPYTAFCLAFAFGQAKGYRAAKAEVRK